MKPFTEERKQKLIKMNDALDVNALVRELESDLPKPKYKANWYGDFQTEIHIARANRWYNDTDHATRNILDILGAYDMYNKFIKQETGLVVFSNGKIIRTSIFNPCTTDDEFAKMNILDIVIGKRLNSICQVAIKLSTGPYETLENVNKQVGWNIDSNLMSALLQPEGEQHDIR